MSSFGNIEREISRRLSRFPIVKVATKALYLRVVYLRHIGDRHRCRLLPGVSIRKVCDHPKGSIAESFFGYFDKSPWHRVTASYAYHVWRGGDDLDVVVCDEDGFHNIGSTTAWNFQQGAMLQWCSAGYTNASICWNDVRNEVLGSVWVHKDGEQFFLPWPIQALHPAKNEMLSINYRQLHKIGSEYGYSSDVVNFSSVCDDEANNGLWLVTIPDGSFRLLYSIEELRTLKPRPDMVNSVHYVNHALYSPSGRNFVFMHRWEGATGRWSRLYVSAQDGTGLRLLLDDRMVSHYCWRDDYHLLAWARTSEFGDRYYLIDVRSGSISVVGKNVLDQFGDGHPSYSPDRRWILTDTYPDKARRRHLMLFDTEEGQIFRVGSFFAPWKYDGHTRCDLHPRWSPDGKFVSIDSTHEGYRASFVLDLSRIIDNEHTSQS